jgi:hypothetical protein
MVNVCYDAVAQPVYSCLAGCVPFEQLAPVARRVFFLRQQARHGADFLALAEADFDRVLRVNDGMQQKCGCVSSRSYQTISG